MPHDYSMKLFVTSLVLGLFSISTASAQQDQVEHRVDRVFGLNQVNDLSIGTTDNSVIVTLSDRVLQLSTFPLRVTADIKLDSKAKVKGLNANVNDDQTLVVLIEQEAKAGLKEGRMRIYRDIARSLDGPLEPIDLSLDTSPFSQALLKGQDEVLAVNPVWNSILFVSISKLVDFISGESNEPFFPKDLILKCGRAGSISVFEHDDTDRYVTSVTDEKLIEIGPLVFDRKVVENVDCFNPIVTSQETFGQQGRQSILHRLIENPYAVDDDREVGKMLLTFDPDDGQVSVFPMREIRKKITILRSARYGLNLATQSRDARETLGDVGLMASDAKGSVILISYQGSKVIHRLQSDDETLTYLGRLNMNKPIQRLEVSSDGKLAVVATSDGLDDGLFDIVLIDNPGALAPDQKLSDQMFSVQNIQQNLGNEGFKVSADGVYGPQTISAISEFLSSEGAPALNGLSAQPVREITRALTIPKPPVQDVKTEIGKALRGLFPLQ